MSKALDVASDELNALFNRVSVLLDRDFHGVYAEVAVTQALKLSFASVGDTWELVIINTSNGGCRVTPLKSASREQRIACAGALPSLRAALSKAQDSLDVRVKQAQKQVLDFIKAYT